MNKLKIFENDRFGKINVQELDGEVYFIGKEIANILEYQNGSRDIKRQVLEAKIEADKEKVMLAEAIETNKASIMIKDLAMILYTNGIKVGQNRLFEILRNEGYLCSAGMYKNKPTQKSLELGIMEFKEHSIKHSNGYNSITFVPMITGKGQGYFVKHFLDKKFNV